MTRITRFATTLKRVWITPVTIGDLFTMAGSAAAMFLPLTLLS